MTPPDDRVETAAHSGRTDGDHEDLAVSERRFRGLFECAGAGIVIADLSRRILEANPAFQQMLGYEREELHGLDLFTITHPDDLAAARERHAALLADGVAYVSEKRYVGRGGDTVWGRNSVSLIRDDQGTPTHIAVTVEDITAAKHADARLRRSEALRRLAGGLAKVGGWSIEAVNGHVYWSEEVFAILEAPSGEEPPLEECLALYPPAHRARLESAIDACFADGTPFVLDLEVDTFTGRRIPVRALAEVERVDGAIVRIIGAFQDISDQRATATAAEALGRRLTATLESMTDALYTVDRDWRFTYLNPRAEVLLQRSAEELLGADLWEQFPEAAGTIFQDVFDEAVATGDARAFEEYFAPLETWFIVHAYPSEQGLAVYFRDNNEEHERRAELERQSMLLDLAQDAIIVRDLANRITFWNRSAERMYGWSRERALGADIRTLLYDDPAAFDAATATVLERGNWVGELHQSTHDGGSIVVNGRWTCVRNADGAPTAVLAINSDVTDQRRIEQQLLRAQRMESIGTLAGGVAHDLNNVLAPILLASDLLRASELAADQRDLVDTIGSSAQRGADLISQVLSFARGVEGERAAVDLGAMMTSLRAIVRDTFPKNLAVAIDLPDDPPTITGDSTQIQQVLVNLAVNARDAMPDGGTLGITVSTVELDAQYVAATPGSTIGDYVLIEVVDDGIGMPPDVRDRVFEPFFTTKPQGSGTGLGLSTAAAIVRSHGGFMRVYSDLGRGTRFAVYLPRDVAEDGSVPSAPVVDDAPRGNGEVVLVVDDEAAVRAMTRQTLEANGYVVLEAVDGADAVSVFAEHRAEVAVVLTDMMMPVMDGPATIRALRRLDPSVRIIGASGLQANGRAARAADAGVAHFLPKPYSSRSLLEMVRRALSHPDGG